MSSSNGDVQISNKTKLPLRVWSFPALDTDDFVECLHSGAKRQCDIDVGGHQSISLSYWQWWSSWFWDTFSKLCWVVAVRNAPGSMKLAVVKPPEDSGDSPCCLVTVMQSTTRDIQFSTNCGTIVHVMEVSCCEIEFPSNVPFSAEHWAEMSKGHVLDLEATLAALRTHLEEARLVQQPDVARGKKDSAQRTSSTLSGNPQVELRPDHKASFPQFHLKTSSGHVPQTESKTEQLREIAKVNKFSAGDAVMNFSKVLQVKRSQARAGIRFACIGPVEMSCVVGGLCSLGEQCRMYLDERYLTPQDWDQGLSSEIMWEAGKSSLVSGAVGGGIYTGVTSMPPEMMTIGCTCLAPILFPVATTMLGVASVGYTMYEYSQNQITKSMMLMASTKKVIWAGLGVAVCCTGSSALTFAITLSVLAVLDSFLGTSECLLASLYGKSIEELHRDAYTDALKILCLPTDRPVTDDEVARAYKQLAFLLHPDKGSPDEANQRTEWFQTVNNAYELICETRKAARARASNLDVQALALPSGAASRVEAIPAY